MEFFLKNKEKLLTREVIIEHVWGIDFDPSTNIIDVYVNYLRKKIDKDFEPKLIHTKFGFGFYCSDKRIIAMNIKTRLSFQFTLIVVGILLFFSILVYYFSLFQPTD